MALPSTGPISLRDVNEEIERGSTTQISLNNGDVRELAGVSSGTISMSNLRGKSWEIIYTNTANRTSANIHSLMGSPTVAGTYIFENHATISAGTSSYALRTGYFPAGSTLIIKNRGTIRGKGGNGGTVAGNGGAGSTALHIDYSCEVNNYSGVISGGGGGGAWRRGVVNSNDIRAGGGGGAGVNGGSRGSTSVTNGGVIDRQASSGSSTGGGVGAAVSYVLGSTTCYAGAGGGRGSAGGTGYGTITPNFHHTNGNRGAGGKAINFNGKSVNITSTGTMHGARS